MTDSPWRAYSVVRSGAMAGKVRDEVPVNDFTITERLKGAGSISATVPSRHPKATPATLDVENTVLVFERGGNPIAAGPFLTKRWTSSSNMWQITSEGPFRILRDRVIRSAASMTYGTALAGEVRFSQIEQFDIVSDLIAHANGIEDTGFTVNAPLGASGILRDRNYEADKAKSIGETIEQLSNVNDGFDWFVDLQGTAIGGDLAYVLRLYHPYRARDTGYRFELLEPTDAIRTPHNLTIDGDLLVDGGIPISVPVATGEIRRAPSGGNVIDAEYADTSQDRVSRFTAVGAGEGASQPVAHALDTVVSGYLPLIEKGGSWPDVTLLSTLQSHADRELTINRRASRLPKVTVDPNKDPQLTAYGVGDVVTVRIDEIGFNESVRIIARTINVDTSGAEKVHLEFAETGRFA